MVVNFRSYINREIFCCFFAEQASLANTRVYNYKNEIKMALHCLSTSGVSGTKKMHILRTEFALISILPRKGKRIARFREEVYSWRDVKTGLDIIEKYSFFWKIGGRRTLPSLPIISDSISKHSKYQSKSIHINPLAPWKVSPQQHGCEHSESSVRPDPGLTWSILPSFQKHSGDQENQVSSPIVSDRFF